MTNARFLDAINKNMLKLATFGEDNLFISQFRDHEDNKHASVMVILPNFKDEDEALLRIRRLLLAFKYKLEEKGIEFDFELKRETKND